LRKTQSSLAGRANRTWHRPGDSQHSRFATTSSPASQKQPALTPGRLFLDGGLVPRIVLSGVEDLSEFTVFRASVCCIPLIRCCGVLCGGECYHCVMGSVSFQPRRTGNFSTRPDSSQRVFVVKNVVEQTAPPPPGNHKKSPPPKKRGQSPRIPAQTVNLRTTAPYSSSSSIRFGPRELLTWMPAIAWCAIGPPQNSFCSSSAMARRRNQGSKALTSALNLRTRRPLLWYNIPRGTNGWISMPTVQSCSSLLTIPKVFFRW